MSVDTAIECLDDMHNVWSSEVSSYQQIVKQLVGIIENQSKDIRKLKQEFPGLNTHFLKCSGKSKYPSNSLIFLIFFVSNLTN